MPAPYDGALSGATEYAQQAAAMKDAFQKATARIQDQRGAFLRAQGLEGTYDANGNLTDTRVAADNPFGAYQQMSQGNAAAGEQNDAAIAGFGFGGGLAQQARDTAQRDYSAQSAQWGTDTIGGLGDLGQKDIEATQDYNNGLLSSFWDTVRGDAQDGKFNPADYSGITLPGYGNPLAPSKPPLTQSPGPWHPPGSTAPAGKKTSKYGNFNAAGKWIPWVPKGGR